jgi:hypothetical protein
LAAANVDGGQFAFVPPLKGLDPVS